MDDLRLGAIAARNALTAEQRDTLSRLAQERLYSHPLWQSASAVMLYYAIGGEVRTDMLMNRALNERKALYLPICQTNGGMHPGRVRDVDELKPGRFGIHEPPSYEDIADIPLIVVPGLLFDRFGGRVGRGAGYYDRFLERIIGTRAGLAFSCQVREYVLQGRFDQRMDALFTDTETLVFRRDIT